MAISRHPFLSSIIRRFTILPLFPFLLFSFPFSALAAPGFDVDTAGTLTTGLRAWYNLESDGTDAFTNGYNMTVTGSPTFGTGKINNAATITANKYISINDTWGIDGGNISVSFFVKINTAPGTNVFYPLITQFNTNTDVAYQVIYRDVSGTKQVRFIRTKDSTADQSVDVNTTLTVGTWYHLVLTYNGTNIEGFINNTSQGTIAASGNGTGGNPSKSTIGTEYNNVGGQEAEADFDLVGVWSKQLSSTEISNLYNSGNGNAYREQPAIYTITGYGTTTNRLAKFTSSTIIADSLLSDDGVDVTLTSGNFLLQAGKILDTVVSGILNIGTSIANAINIGKTGVTTTIHGLLSWVKMSTTVNCNSTSSPASCSSAPAGSVALSVGATTLTVSSTAVTADSQILITEDFSLGSRLGITCNTTNNRTYRISARVSGVSFTIQSDRSPTTNVACLSYLIVN